MGVGLLQGRSAMRNNSLIEPEVLGAIWSGPPRCRKLFRRVATSAVFCNKETARRIQSPLRGALERKIPLAGSLCHKDSWLHPLKGPIIGANECWIYLPGGENFATQENQ